MWTLKPYQWALHTPYYITITGLSCTQHGNLTHAWFCNIMLWSFGKLCFTKLFRFSKYLCILCTARTTKSHLLISPPISSKKVFKYWEVGNLWEQIQFFQNSNTCLKAQILLLASIQLVVVFEVTDSLWSCETSSKHHSIWINIVSVAVILLSKKVIPWKKGASLIPFDMRQSAEYFSFLPY